jgi:hypothetical protein
MLKYIFLILFCLTSCNYIDNVAEDAAKNAMGDCPSLEQIEFKVLDAIDDAFEAHREDVKEDIKEVLKEVLDEQHTNT